MVANALSRGAKPIRAYSVIWVSEEREAHQEGQDEPGLEPRRGCRA